jgi:hypothetical protein
VPGVPTTVYVSEHGNVFMREIAERLVEALHLSGRSASLVTHRLPDGDPHDHLVLAPHEFFPLFDCAESDRLRSAASATCINTEQPGTPFFDLAVRYASVTGRALDMNPVAARALDDHGITAVHLPLGWVPSLEAADPPAHRSTDVLFLAGRTERRERFVGGAGSLLWEWECDLRFFSWHRPATADRPSFLVGSDKLRRLADSRVLLNVHRDELPYFEWARVLEAIANGCAVASEDSVDIAPLEAGQHLVMASFDQLAEQAVALLLDEPRRQQMTDDALALLRHDHRQADLLDVALARLGDVPVRARRPRPNIRDLVRGTPVHRAARSVRDLIGAPAGNGEVALLERQAAELKRAYLGQLQVIRGLERSLAAVDHGHADHVDITTTGDHQAEPDITVVVPLYDQANFVGDALDSIAGSSSSYRLEVVVVDDHSRDDGAAAVLAWGRQHTWVPLTLVSRRANGGLPVARNTGFGHARGRYVMALDADNLMYPNGLHRLASALERSDDDVVATYGLLERFDAAGSVGLTSHLPWDPDLLVHGAFIDAMAMFHLDRWRSTVGGYADDTDLYGWEDYDLWLTVAEQGRRAQQVPTIVGRYREQPGSMRRLSDIDMASNFVALRQRHPRLPWP